MATFDDIVALCSNDDDLSESELISRLKAAQITPDIFLERGEYGLTLLHNAAAYGRSPEFSHVLHELDVTLVKTQDNAGWLPVHDACLDGNLETAKHLLELYHDSIHIPKGDGEYPLHLLANCHGGSKENLHQLVSYLLKHDQDVVSSRNKWGELPLHIACKGIRGLAFVKLFFDMHPDGIFVRDEDGNTPVGIARSENQADVVNFFETQIEFHRQAQEDQERDNKGQIPIHRVLQSPSENVSLGTIKLMVEAHRVSVAVVDSRGCIPLHYACRLGDLNIVKYLVEGNEDLLQIRNSQGEFPLHVACRHGRCNVINYILEKSNLGVSVVNAKKLPIQALLFDADCDRDSLEFVEAVGGLLFAHPVNPADLVKKED